MLSHRAVFLGAHESVAGGLFRAFEHAGHHLADAIQVFTKNSNQWREPPLDPSAVGAFRDGRSAWGAGPIVSHASYLVNVASDRPEIRDRSIDALVAEMERCDRLGISVVAFHPGAAVGATDDEALPRAVESLQGVLDRTRGLATRLAIENTAGQGSAIGWSLEQIARLVDGAGSAPDRLAVCIDTQHLFAAGYDLRSADGYDRFWQDFDQAIGIDRLACLHLNDSKKALGERVDRHEEIGAGHIGLYPFWRLVNDPRLDALPGIVELEPAQAASSLVRLRALRGAPEPTQVHVTQPLVLTAPETSAPRRRDRTR